MSQIGRYPTPSILALLAAYGNRLLVIGGWLGEPMRPHWKDNTLAIDGQRHRRRRCPNRRGCPENRAECLAPAKSTKANT